MQGIKKYRVIISVVLLKFFYFTVPLNFAVQTDNGGGFAQVGNEQSAQPIDPSTSPEILPLFSGKIFKTSSSLLRKCRIKATKRNLANLENEDRVTMQLICYGLQGNLIQLRK